jgi:hypothetical protein
MISIPQHAWRLAGAAFALSMAPVPRRFRFTLARRLAWRFSKVVRATAVYRSRVPVRMDSEREVALERALAVLTRRGLRFDPVMRWEGLELLEEAVGAGRGLLVCGPHSMLNALVVRKGYDLGLAPAVVSAGAVPHVSGTDRPIDIIHPSPRLLLDVRRMLRDGRTVGALIDGEEDDLKYETSIPTTQGTVRVSLALFQVALHCDALILFMAARVDDEGNVVATVGSPSERTMAAISADFTAFVQRHVERVFG